MPFKTNGGVGGVGKWFLTRYFRAGFPSRPGMPDRRPTQPSRAGFFKATGSLVFFFFVKESLNRQPPSADQ